MKKELIWIVFIFILVVVLLISSSYAFYVPKLSPGADVKVTVIKATCGDNICQSTESCAACSSDCGACPPPPGGGGGGGRELVTECNDKIDNDGDGLIDLADLGCANTYDDSEIDLPCSPGWQCDEWGQCVQETLIQQRICFDINYCSKPLQKIETQSCYVYVEPKKCVFLFLPCWLWIVILIILMASAIYYYYKKKKEVKDKSVEKPKQVDKEQVKKIKRKKIKRNI